MDDTQQAMPAPISGPIPGEVRLAAGTAGPAGTARTAGTAGPIELNAGAPRTTLTVLNTGDRPVQVGSHYHLAEANPALDFDRDAAWGLRLDIPAGTAVRFEPGLAREVALVPIAGRRIVTGLRGISGARQEGRLDG